MNTSRIHTLIIVMLCSALAAAVFPGSASAAARLAQTTDTPTPTGTAVIAAPAALTLSGIEPASIASDLGGPITLFGDGFDTSTVALLSSVGVLATTYVNTATLTALVPRGLPAGAYTVEVRNGAGESAQLVNALTITPAPTLAPTAKPTDPPPPPRFVRPLMTVATYSTNPGTVIQGRGFTLTVLVKNVGDDTAFNIALTAPAGDFVASGNAGTLIFPKLKPGESAQFDQALIAKSGIGGGLKTLELKLAYNDRNGGSYSESAPVAITVAGGGSGSGATPTPTPQPKTPQMVVSGYRTEPAILMPGTMFTLTLDINNVGSADATRLSAVLGGAATSSSSSGGDATGGVSGSGGDFATFGPIGSSNVKFIPSVATTETVSIAQRLIVNSTAKAGAYTVKVSLVYDDPKGERRTDDQVITLLVVQPPSLEISYYRPLDPAFAGQPWSAPVQVVNVGRNTAQLGRMEIVGPEGVDVQNGSIFVGPLEAGGQYPLDALVFANEPGPLALTVNVHYIDDFNEAKLISATLDVEVMPFEPPPIEPGDGGPGEVPPPVEESFLDALVRAFLGLIGLDSARPTPDTGIGVPSGPEGPAGPDGPVIVPLPGPSG